MLKRLVFVFNAGASFATAAHSVWVCALDIFCKNDAVSDLDDMNQRNGRLFSNSQKQGLRCIGRIKYGVNSSEGKGYICFVINKNSGLDKLYHISSRVRGDYSRRRRRYSTDQICRLCDYRSFLSSLFGCNLYKQLRNDRRWGSYRRIWMVRHRLV